MNGRPTNEDRRTATVRAALVPGLVGVSLLLLCAVSSVARAQPAVRQGANGAPRPERVAEGPAARRAADAARDALEDEAANGLPAGLDPEQMLSPGGMSSTLKVMALLTVLSLAPSILIMTTSFVRFVVVFGLLRQAMGTQQLPPNQVLVSLSLFMTLAVMGPAWRQAYEEGIQPYTSQKPGERRVTLDEAFQRTARPIRRFMAAQIQATGNSDAVWMFVEFQNPDAEEDELPETYEEVPLTALMPAFLLSELKTAFVIGFQLYLPFLVIDMVVASVLVSMGMMMLPPVLVSLPFKLLLFVLVDGWYLVVGAVLESVQPFS